MCNFFLIYELIYSRNRLHNAMIMYCYKDNALCNAYIITML